MTLDSATFAIYARTTNEPVYLTSDDKESTWGGQPPLSKQTCVGSQTKLIDDIYVSAILADQQLYLEPDLALEFAAWEAASDEALQAFEANLDQ